MSFILRKKPSAGAPRVSHEAVPSLPPDLVAAGGRRLAVLGLITATGTVLMSAVDWHTFARVPLPPQAQTLWLTAGVAEILISVAVSWIAFREMLGPETLLDLGLVFEVALALCIAVSFHAVPLRPDFVPHGWTGVAVWIIVYPLIVPASRGKTVLSTLAAAPALIVSRIVYQLSVEAGKGQEMGSYNLEELLGRGGMGEVWKASHKLLARSAAIKLTRRTPPERA